MYLVMALPPKPAKSLVLPNGTATGSDEGVGRAAGFKKMLKSGLGSGNSNIREVLLRRQTVQRVKSLSSADAAHGLHKQCPQRYFCTYCFGLNSSRHTTHLRFLGFSSVFSGVPSATAFKRGLPTSMPLA